MDTPPASNSAPPKPTSSHDAVAHIGAQDSSAARMGAGAGAKGGAQPGPFQPARLRAAYGDWARVGELLRREGVAVVTGTLTEADVAASRRDLQAQVAWACPGARMDDAASWAPGVLPPQSRAGLFQCVLGNLPAVWAVRAHPRVATAFRHAYAGMRELADPAALGPMVTSVDGVNIKPPGTPPFATPPSEEHQREWPGSIDWASDWAHTDQATEDWWLSVQGQVVLSDTSAGFVCSPRSHRLIGRVLDLAYGAARTGKEVWCTLRSRELYERVARMVYAAGGHFQVPVGARKGDLVLWSSCLVHSARFHLPPAAPAAPPVAAHAAAAAAAARRGETAGDGSGAGDDVGAASGAGGGAGAGSRAGAGAGAEVMKPEDGTTTASDDWRLVVYVCHRPLRDVGSAEEQQAHVERLQACFNGNRVTNHCGTCMFPKCPVRREVVKQQGAAATPRLQQLLDSPEALYDDPRLKPRLTAEVAALIGLPPVPSDDRATAGIQAT